MSNAFEDHLLRGIPHDEAAAYFIRIRGRDKVAVDAAAFEAVIAEMPDEERAAFMKSASVLIANAPGPGTLKKANMGMGAPAPQAALPATGKGMNMSPAPPPPLPPTAMGQQTQMPKMGSSDKSPDEVGKERGRASVAAEFEKEKHHQHESNRNLIGHLGGAALGAAIGHKMKGNATSKVLSTLAGSHLGGLAGKHSGQAADRKAFDKSAAAFKIALDSMGIMDSGKAPQMSQQGAQAGQTGVDPNPKTPLPTEMSQQPQPQAIEPQIAPEIQQYLQAQQAGDQAAEMGHADFLRAKLDEARAGQQAAEEQAATLQEAQAMHEQQQMQVQQQVQESIQQASAAQDQVLQEQQAAAAMRMAYQQLRGQVLQIASTDPPSLSTDAAAMSASAAAGPSSAPAPQAGPAGQAPTPGTPNTPAPMGDETVTDKIAPNEPMFGNAEPTSQAGTKEPQGDAKTPQKEVLSHYLPLDLRKLLR
jgi:hypothetical protein